MYMFSSKWLQNNMPIFCCCCPLISYIVCVISAYTMISPSYNTPHPNPLRRPIKKYDNKIEMLARTFSDILWRIGTAESTERHAPSASGLDKARSRDVNTAISSTSR